MMAATCRGLSLLGARRMSTLVVAEHQNGKVMEQTLAAISAAQKINQPVTLLLAGSENAAQTAKNVQGLAKVTFVTQDKLGKGVAEQWTPLILKLHEKEGYTHIVGGSSSFVKGLFPRVAALLDVAQVSDVVEVKDDKTFVRPIYAGNALATVESADAVKVLTIRPTSFEKAATEGGEATVTEMEAIDSTGKTVWVSEEVRESDRPELSTAKTVISGGRGMKSGDNFAMLDKLALKLNAAVGASRAAVDAGMCPNDMQVGQTGKVVAPDLYVAVGISGAIQHLAGMKDSKKIVAINKDPEAPIFQVADYGVVDDLFKVVPKLDEMIEK